MNLPKLKMDIPCKRNIKDDPEFTSQVLPMLPRDEIHMISRITEIDPNGGKYLNGYISAEYDIDPSSWIFGSFNTSVR